MKKAVLYFLFIPIILFSQKRSDVEIDQKHIGIVSEVVVPTKGQILIQVLGQSPIDNFTAVISLKVSSTLTNPQLLKGKTIEISGRMTSSKGNHVISIIRAEQIKEIPTENIIIRKPIAEHFGISLYLSLLILSLLIILFVFVFWLFRIVKTNQKLFEQSENHNTLIDSLNKDITQQKETYNLLYEKYKDLIDLDAAICDRNKILETKELEIQNMNDDYIQKKSIYVNLNMEIARLEEDLDLKEFGIYKPHFNFDTSNDYRVKIEKNWVLQKSCVKDGKAILCETEWKVNNRIVEGRAWTQKQFRLMLRAFNGECDSAILKVKWNNIRVMEERIKKSYDGINKLGTNSQIHITNDYLNLKMEELHLTYEYQEKLHEEREEQRRIREMMREEEKVQKEIADAIKESEDEEKVYKSALEKAKEEIEKSTGDKLNSLNTRIADLEKQLKDAIEKKERALSLAQLTKSGHVYIISNIGSFGENVYKIGMTRRLDPMDRVRELGDASVPFAFDVHAIIYSENAPELEYKLQKAFERKRLNMVNYRKEFFNANLDEIEKEVNENYGKIEFVKLPEARQFRETKALLDTVEPIEVEKESAFPDSLI